MHWLAKMAVYWPSASAAAHIRRGCSASLAAIPSAMAESWPAG